MKLPIPQRGQPVDVTFLSDIVSSINDLYNQIVVKVSAYASIWVPGGRKQVRISEVKLFTTQISITVKNAAADAMVIFNGSFDIGFKNPPIVVATPFGTTKAIRNSSVTIDSVDTASFKGYVNLETAIGATAETITINVIAIGIPT
jgi:hypothetical protein